MSLAVKLKNTRGSATPGSRVLQCPCSYDIRRIKRLLASYWSFQNMVDKRKLKVMSWNFLSRWLAIRKKIFVKISMGYVIFKSTFACEYNGLYSPLIKYMFIRFCLQRKIPVVEWGEVVVLEHYLGLLAQALAAVLGPFFEDEPRRTLQFETFCFTAAPVLGHLSCLNTFAFTILKHYIYM